MKKFIARVIMLPICVIQGFAQNFYTVKNGDTLSHIVKKHFPSEKLYGPNGKISEVLLRNPHINDPNVIYPNLEIQFEKSEIVSKPVIPESVMPEPVNSETLQLEEWNISALYGVNYLSISQSGALGKADIGVVLLNNLTFNSEFIVNDWSLGFQLNSYKFKYQTLTSSDAKQIYSLNLFGSYKWFMAGLNIEQGPLFRNNSGNIEITKMTLISASIGAKKDINFSLKKPTTLKLKGWVNYPLSTSSENANIKLNSISGLKISGQAELNRQISSKNDYSLHATWMSQIGIQKIKQDVEWGVSLGESKSEIVEASTSLGILIKF